MSENVNYLAPVAEQSVADRSTFIWKCYAHVIGAIMAFAAIEVYLFQSGIAYAIAVPVVSSLPALVLHPENRGPGFGIFQVWYFAGSALMPIAAGYLQDLTGGATASLLFATGMMFAVLCLHGVFRFEQRRLAAD